MKVILTPFNFITAISMVAIIAIVFNQSWIISPQNQEFKGLFIAIALLLLFGSFLFDQILRKFTPNLKRLWIVQCLIIVLTIIFIYFLKSIFIQ